MSKTLTIIAAAATLIAGNLVASAPAEANGVRLGFGFPLGSFVARPSGNGGGSSSYSHRAPSYAYHQQRREARAAAVAQARREAAAEAKRAAIAQAKRDAAADAKREAIAQAKRDAAAEARREKLAADRAEARRLARSEERRNDKSEPVDAAAPAVVETASLAPEAAPVPGRPEGVQAEVAIGEPKIVLGDETAKDLDSTPVKAAVSTAEAPSKRPLDCRKFIPSAGLTISVPCAN